MEGEAPFESSAAPATSSSKATSGSVQDVLESLFSKKNLVRDQLLASQMNAQMYIHIGALLEHEKLQAVGATEADVVEAATKSSKLGIDDRRTMVRPLLKSKRNVVILRDLAADTTEAELMEFLKGSPHAERLEHVKAEVNNTWFAKFKVDDTQDVVLWLRSQTFKGKPVNAAIKSEHFLRSFVPLHLATAGATTMPMSFDPCGRPPGVSEDVEGLIGSWAAESADLPLPPGFEMVGPPPPPPLPEGMQLPGYWEPWGSRHQSPPLVFTSPTTLSESSQKAIAEEVANLPPDTFANPVEEEDRSPSRSKGMKGGTWWQSGKAWQSLGWQDEGWPRGKGWQDTGWWSGGGSGWDDGAQAGGYRPRWVRRGAPTSVH